MKYSLILILITSLVACRSYRKKNRQESSTVRFSEASSGIRYGFRLIEKDSQNRTWYFATDSLLSFHPDYGLFSKGGYLHIRESRTGLQQLQVEVDSLEQTQEVDVMTEVQTHNRMWYKNVWVWALVAGCACVIVFWRNG